MYQEEHLPAGTIIDGKYTLEHPIGVGGMGAVYFATQSDLGRRVAIKLLHPQFRRNTDVIERFHREARLAASIGHDNICEVTDYGVHTDGSPYLVMPILKGSSLADILKNERLEIGRVCDIMRQVLSALDAAHVAGVVHRDLKPDNIFISQMGDRKDFVKLLDFGISKVMESDAGGELTRTGTVMGTPVYMAPEQARGEKKVDHRLDIYAAGVIMYEALTGKRPHDGESYNEIVFKIIAEPYPLPRSLNPAIPKKLEKVVLKAMSKETNDRFNDAKEMGNAIDFVMSSEVSSPSLVNSNEAVPIQPRPQGTHRLIPILVLFVLLIAAGTGALFWYKKGEDSGALTYVNVTNRAALPEGPLRSGQLGNGVPQIQLTSLPNQTGASLKKAAAVHIPSKKSEPAPVKKPESPVVEDKPKADHHAVFDEEKNTKESPALLFQKSKRKKDKASKKKDEATKSSETEPKESTAETNGKADIEKSTTPAKTAAQASPTTSTPPSPPVTPTPAPPVQTISIAQFTNMNQLKLAYKQGRISQAQYAQGQSNIQSRRNAELNRLKATYQAGKIDRQTYNYHATQIKQKYETGKIATKRPARQSYTNMRQLKTAVRQGLISREQYAVYQEKIRFMRAAEYEKIKRDYRDGKMSRDEYKQRLAAAKRKFEGR